MTEKNNYNFKIIEKKWQKKWEEQKIFVSKIDNHKEKVYVLEMFPYPSGLGLHIGHSLNFTIGDIRARFLRMLGKNVFYPMGYDSFGLPAENAAIQANIHPRKYTQDAIKNFIKQQKALGFSYDWSKILSSCEPEYYKWNQFFFLKFLEKGLIYRKKSPVNWCPKCNTVLANEQIHDGKCWRHLDTEVEIKNLDQWFIKTTKYADELLKGLDELNWPQRIKLMQKNWIGKSFGTEINFEVNGKKFPIFTTRPDTIYGVTFMVISAQHSKLFELVTKEQEKEIKEFLKKIKSVSEKEQENLEKEGVFTGSYAINPVNNEKIPIYAGNFVIADYGSGMVMAVPAHDQRDFEFAKKYGIKIKQVISPVLGNFERTKKLLELLKKIKIESDKIKLKFWLLGGVALAFHRGFVYREHEDLDILVKNESDMKKLEELLKKIGLRKNKEKIVEGITLYSYKNQEGLEVEIGHYTKNKCDLKESDFDEKEKILEGVSSLVLAKSWLKTLKEKQLKERNSEKDKLDFKYLVEDKAYTGPGNLINSEKFNGLNNEKAKEEIIKYLEKNKLGKKTIQYKLRDWLISRQRYWGTPIPIIYCDKCGIVPVPEKDLPVLLPEKVKFGKGNPLETNKKFLDVKCPICGADAKRETDTMDTFVDSSWYYMRYFDNQNDKAPFDKKNQDYWLPVDTYIGGAEHATMHLLYARFWTKALRDLGFIDYNEPFIQLFNQGMLHALDGRKMSKSFGNVLNPLEIIEKNGADSLRLTLMSFASPDSDTNWDEKVLTGSFKFLNRIFSRFNKIKIGKSTNKIESKLNKTIKIVTEKIQNFKYNLAIIELRELFDSLSEQESREVLEKSLQLLHPFCPHITEELWEKLGNKNFISLSKWPEVKEGKIDKKFEEQEKIVEKFIEDINHLIKLIRDKKKEIKKVYVYVLPDEKRIYAENINEIYKKTGRKINIFAVNDKDKYDPENKSKKARPNRPAVYIE